MSWETELDENVHRYLPGLKWLSGEPMSKHTSFRIGGPAKRMACPSREEELVILAGFIEEAGARMLVLGSGTNVLCPDEGLDAVVVSTGELNRIERSGETELSAGAGTPLARLATEAWKAELSGLAFAHGIPGSLGGGVVMNAGAYGGEMADVLTEVTALWPDGIRTMKPEELRLSYRRSVFTEHPEAVVLSARVALQKGDGAEIRSQMNEYMERRKTSQPLEYPSAGSTFKRPAGYYAGSLIEQCGLKGRRVGGAEVSVKHAGFLINVGNASCADVLRLIETVRETVFREAGVMLEPEVKLLH